MQDGRSEEVADRGSNGWGGRFRAAWQGVRSRPTPAFPLSVPARSIHKGRGLMRGSPDRGTSYPEGGFLAQDTPELRNASKLAALA